MLRVATLLMSQVLYFCLQCDFVDHLYLIHRAVDLPVFYCLALNLFTCTYMCFTSSLEIKIEKQ